MDTAHTAPAFETDQQIRDATASFTEDRRDNCEDLDLYLTAVIWRSGGLSHDEFGEELDGWLVRRSSARQHRLELLQRHLGVQTGAVRS